MHPESGSEKWMILLTVTKYKACDTLSELNQIHKNVKFTAEEEVDGEIPFLDCLITKTEGNKLKTKVYKKAITYWPIH